MLVEKQRRLKTRLRHLGSVIVAFSGGVDSTLVLAVAHSVLGPKVLAVTSQSESFPKRELSIAKQLTHEMGVEHLVIKTNEMRSFQYRKNSIDRCYHCKTELYAHLKAIARERNFDYILNGINADDMGDYRPGILAAEEAGILSPLRDEDFSKDDVRGLSRELGLTVWGKPATACLSSRIPYNKVITRDKLLMVEKAEDFLQSLGFTQVRVRHHGEIARIELLKGEMSDIFEDDHLKSIQKYLKGLGFKYITLDIEGFRSGSLNETLRKD